MAEIILEVKGLSKNYGKVRALDGLSLEVEQGSVFGLLGPNGSGKTTTLGILLGIIYADSGSFSWFGNGAKDENRQRIGAILETPNFYPYLSAYQNLKVSSLIKNLNPTDGRIDSVLNQVGLADRAKDKFRTYSLGMKQRLAIASALISDPEVLVLDEPTNGLDPEGIAEIRSLISDIAKSGKTIIIASHILDEIEKICTDVAIMRKGILLNVGKLEVILGNQDVVTITCVDYEGLKIAVKELSWINVLEDHNNHLQVKLDEGKTATDVNRALFDKGIVLSEIKSDKQKLESIFLETVKA